MFFIVESTRLFFISGMRSLPLRATRHATRSIWDARPPATRRPANGTASRSTSVNKSPNISELIFKHAMIPAPASTIALMDAKDVRTRFAPATTQKLETATIDTAWTLRLTIGKAASWNLLPTRMPTTNVTLRSSRLQENARAILSAALAVPAKEDSNARSIL